MIIRSPDALGFAFAVPVWQQGNPIGTDPGPNVTPPSASRIATIQVPVGTIMIPQTAIFRAFVVGGTSVTFVGWKFDPHASRTKWDVIALSTTLTAANATVTLAPQIGFSPAFQYFLQVTAVNNTGSNVKAFGYGLF